MPPVPALTPGLRGSVTRALDRSGAVSVVRESGGFGRWVPVVVLGMVAAVAEAAALVAVVQLAAAVSSDSDLVELRSGVLQNLPALSVRGLLSVCMVIIVIRLIAQVAFAVRTARLGAETTVRMRRKVIEAWLRADWETQTSRRAGEVSHLALGLVHAAASSEIVLARAATNVCNLIALSVVAFLVSPTVAVVTFVVLGLLFVLLRPLAGRVRTVSAELVEANGGLSNGVLETANNLEEFRLLGVADRRATELLGQVDEIGVLWQRSQILNRVVQPLYQGLGLAFVVAGIAGARSLEPDQIGALGAVVVLLVRALTYSGLLQAAYQQLQSIAPSVDFVREEVDAFLAAEVVETGAPVTDVGVVEFEHVSFTYPVDAEGDPRQAVLTDTGFRIERGEVVGLVGRSGAGKSTVVQLLLRLRSPSSGRVLIDGTDLAHCSPSAYQRHLAVVPQTPRLIRGTVSENIRYLRDDITDGDIEFAASLAGVHAELLALPDGYDTVVGEGADALSGGQLQRVALARALAGRPSVLVLDEPTSALDPIAEQAVQAAIESLRGAVTVVVIAHRSTTLSVCDRLLRVADGMVTSHDSISGLRSETDPLAALLGDLA